MQQEGDDQVLVRAVLAGDRTSVTCFIQRAANIVWASCRRLTHDELEARNAFDVAMAALQAKNFACLRAFDGRGNLNTYIALTVRDSLGTHVLRLLIQDINRGWHAFHGLFEADLRRLIQRRLPGTEFVDERQDAYQEICVGLIAEDGRRLKTYEGHGSFSGFVLHTADHLLIDFIRSFRTRRRMPATVSRLPELAQEIFRLVYWQHEPTDRLDAGPVQRFNLPPSRGEIEAALAQLRQCVPGDYQAPSFIQQVSLSDVPEPETDVSPETLTLEQENDRTLALAMDALRATAAHLSEEEQRYLQIMLSAPDTLPAREIAQLMQLPVAAIYKLKQRLMKKLKDQLSNHAAVKNWLTSV